MEIRDGEFRVYLGDYHYYLEKIAEEKEQAKLEAILLSKAKANAAEKAAKANAKKAKATSKKG